MTYLSNPLLLDESLFEAGILESPEDGIALGYIDHEMVRDMEKRVTLCASRYGDMAQETVKLDALELASLGRSRYLVDHVASRLRPAADRVVQALRVLNWGPWQEMLLAREV